MVRSCLRLGAAAVVLALPGVAQDTTSAVALGGGGGGLLDVDGLQNSLKSGGVEGLNKMLQAMAAAGGAGGTSPHLTKDASGNAMYDFRDISGPPKSTPAVQEVAAPPATLKAAAASVAPLAHQAPVQSTLTASSRPDDELPMPDFGIIEPAKTQKTIRAAARSLVAAKVTAMTSDQDNEDEEKTPEPGVQESHLIVWPPEPPTVAAPQVKVATAAVGRMLTVAPIVQVQQSTSTDEVTAAALANGLESMRNNVDTLLGEADSMLHSQKQAAPTAVPASASIGSAGGAAGTEILKRLQAIEDENRQMRSTAAAQTLRLKAVEAKEQKEGAELKELEKENVRMKEQLPAHIKASQSTAFLQDKKTPKNNQMKWGIKTFFHKKEKIRSQ